MSIVATRSRQLLMIVVPSMLGLTSFSQGTAYILPRRTPYGMYLPSSNKLGRDPLRSIRLLTIGEDVHSTIADYFKISAEDRKSTYCCMKPCQHHRGYITSVLFGCQRLDPLLYHNMADDSTMSSPTATLPRAKV